MADMSQVLLYTIEGNAAGLVGAAGQAEGALTRLEGVGGRVGGAFVSVAEAATRAAVAVGAIGVGLAATGLGIAIKDATGFQQAISNIGAVAGATSDQMKQLHDTALQLGAATSFTAKEAAAGMEELVKAGVSVTDVIGGGAKGALDLAAAGGISVAEAATIASNAMNVFNKSGADMGHIADVISGAANASAIDVHEFGFSLSAVGAVAATVGLSLEDTATAIAVLGQAGLKGSDAGTSLKTMLLNLSPSTKAATQEMKDLGIITADGANQFFDASGKAKSMADIAGVLKTATAGLTQEQRLNALQTIFGTDAIRAAAIMATAGAEGFNNMAAAEAASGGAAAVANARLDNLAGSLEKLKGSLETAAITVGEHFLPPLKRLADAATDLVNRSLPALDRFGTVAGAMFDALITKAIAAGPQLVALGRFFSTLGASAGIFGTALVGLAQGAIPRATAAIGRLLGLEIRDYGGQWDLLGGIVTRATDLIGSGIGAVGQAFGRLAPIAVQLGRVVLDNIIVNFTFLTQRVLPPLVSIVEQTAGFFFSRLLPAVQQTSAVMRGVLGDTLDWLAKTAWPPLLTIIGQTADFFTSKILPVIPPLAAALRTVLGESLQWLATTGWPAVLSAAGVVVDFFTANVLPAIVPVAAAIRDLLGQAIQWVATTGWPMFLSAAQTVATFITGTVLPAVQQLAQWLQTNVPPAVAAVLDAFTQLRGRLAPIVQAVFSGDIATALKGLGSAFVDFAALAMGWLGDQVAKVNWTQVWAQATTVATALGTYVAGLVVDFATWLGAQAAAINWADVWGKATEVAAALATYLGGLAVDFATWLGQEVAKIPWATVWGQIKDAALTLGTYLLGQTIDFATWLGQQAAAIPWANVWTQIKDAAVVLATYLQGLAVDFATWLGQQVAKIPWDTVWANVKLTGQQVIDAIAKAVGNLDIALSTWLELQIEHVDWKGLGESFGRFLAGVLLPNTQAAVDGIGPGLKPETVRAAIRDFFIGVIEGAFAEIKPALQKAWDDAIRSITPTRPNWWPASVPWPFGPQPGSGMEFPASPGAGGGSPGAAGGGPVQQGAQPYDPNSWEGTAYRAAVDAGHPDPIQFVEQMRQESNFDPDVISGRRRSSAGAIGIAQFMPATAASLGVDPLDPQASLDAAARLMKSYYDKYGDSATALAAYNAGEGAVQRYGGVPPYTETRSYVSTITQRTEAARQANPINVTGQGSPQVAGGGQATGMPDPNEMVTIESNTGGRLQAPRSMIGEGPGQYSADPDRGGYHIVADAAAPASMQTMAATARPQYTLPIEGMGTAQPHWGESMGGSDIFAPEGTPVHSVGDGTVISIGSGGPGGNSVLIQGDDGNQYYYAHLQGTPDVKRGQRVSVGDVLGGVGTTGNAAGTPPHLHLGIGQSIQNGVGPEGGVGTPLAGGGNAIQFLNDIRDGKYGEPLQTLQKQLDDSGQSLSMLDQEAAAAGVKLEDLGTDAATAATDGVAPLQTAVADTSTAVAGMSEATLTATTDMSTGLTETLGVAATGVVQTFTDMSGNVVGQVAQLADGTTVTMGDMAAGVATTVTDMGTGIQTVMTDTAGNAITTVTDMAGNVVSQTVGMGVDSTAAATQMATDVEAQAAVMAAQAILEAAGMQTGVTGAATAMATDSAAQLDALAGSAEGSFGTVVEAAGSVAEPLGTAASDIGAVGGAANGATGPIDTFAGALDSVPDLDMSKTISELEDVKSAAEDAAKAVDDIGSSGDGGKSKKNGKSGKGGGNKNKASDDGDSGDGGDGGDGGDEQGFAIGGVLPEDIFGRGLSGKRYRLHGNEVVLSPAGRGGSGPDGSLDIDYDKLAAAFIRAGAGQKNLSVTVNTQAKESSLLHDVEILEAMAGGR